MERMNAFICCVLHLRQKDLEDMSENEFYQAWGRVKFYLETVHQIEFK